MVSEVAPDAVERKLAEDEDVTVVDIRSPREYAEGHVPGAINLPLQELPRRVEEVDWDADEVVCVCHIGESSVQAARLLASYEELDGDDVASMAGGYRAWDGELEQGRPDDSASPGASDDDGASAGESSEASASEPDEGPQAPF